MHDVCNSVINNMREFFQAEAGLLVLLEPVGYTTICTSPAEPGLTETRRPAVLDWVIDRVEPLLVADINHDDRFASDIRAITGLKPRSVLGAPLVVEAKATGGIVLINPAPSLANPEGVKFLCAMAAQAAVCFEAVNLAAKELQKSKNLSKIGRLTIGVAHELNNPLSVVVGYADLLQQQTDLPEQHRESANMIFKQAERARLIVKDLLAVPRDFKLRPEPTDINQIILASVTLMEDQFRAGDIQLTTNLADQLQPTMADSNKLQQVLVNLFTNAIQALSTSPANRQVKISTRQDNELALISVFDNGPNIPEKIIKHIFDPFFSTKKTEQGTGLGLSICAGIVGAHEGHIWVENSPGAGKTFFVQLPLHPVPVRTTIEPARSRSVPYKKPTRALKILVVDDEESLLTMLHQVLAKMGHIVDTVSNGNDALQMIASQPFDLVICDMLMPDITGPQLYEQVVSEKPALADGFLFISGNTIDPASRTFFKQVGALWLGKPFRPGELAVALDRLTAERSQPATD